jgi:hypothetical protein
MGFWLLWRIRGGNWVGFLVVVAAEVVVISGKLDLNTKCYATYSRIMNWAARGSWRSRPP